MSHFPSKIDTSRIKQIIRRLYIETNAESKEQYTEDLNTEIEEICNLYSEVFADYMDVVFTKNVNGGLASEKEETFKTYIQIRNPYENGLEGVRSVFCGETKCYMYIYNVVDREKFSTFLLENSETLS